MNELVFNQQLGLCIIIFYYYCESGREKGGNRNYIQQLYNLMTLSLSNSLFVCQIWRERERGRIKEDLQHIGGAEEAREIDDGTGI